MIDQKETSDEARMKVALRSIERHLAWFRAAGGVLSSYDACYALSKVQIEIAKVASIIGDPQ